MGCTNCKKKKTTEIQNVVYEDIESKIESNFRLKGIVGIIQMSFGSGQFISNANITDDLAIEFLKVNPNRISMFEAYPENWKELVQGVNNDEGVKYE